MNKKWAPYILISILLAALLIIKPGKKSTNTASKTTTKTGSVNRERGFDRRTTYLEYSKHANCRMECREISKSEVEQIMRDGKINYRKSDLKNARCPRYAVEGTTSDQQEVRIVFAQCNEKTVVVTVIDLETEFACHCPGYDKSPINKKVPG